MYSAKVSNSMTIDNRTGEAKLNDIDVNVDGFSDTTLLEKARENYNSGEEIKERYHAKKDWPDVMWDELYYDMFKKMLKWRKRNYTK